MIHECLSSNHKPIYFSTNPPVTSYFGLVFPALNATGKKRPIQKNNNISLRHFIQSVLWEAELYKLRHLGIMATKKWRENEKMKRKWGEVHSLHFLIFSFFRPSRSISYNKNCLILSQNVKYGTFVANVTKNIRAVRK